jgi:hypothetical protein
MLEGLLVVERMVLESLSRKGKNVYEIAMDTGLDESLLKNIIPFFLMQNIVLYEKGIYSLNLTQNEKWIEKINKREHLKEEVKELFTSLVNKYFCETVDNEANAVELKVQKIWLTPSEEKIINSYLKNIENYIKNIEDERTRKPVQERLCEKKVFIWGQSDYSHLVNGAIEAI